MNKKKQSIWQKIALLAALWGGAIGAYGQVKNAYLEIKFEAPNLAYTPLIDWENYERTERKQNIEANGYWRVSVPLERSQVVYVNYSDTANVIHIHQFFLPKGDTLKCKEQKGKFVFEGQSKAVQINHFLIETGIFGDDTLRQKPLMRNANEAMYASLMQNMADETWHRYQTTQDTTDATQNVFVKAALEAQQYLRSQYFLATKEWTDEMFDGMNKGAVFFPNDDVGHDLQLRIIPHEEAILSRDYWSSLFRYLGGNLYLDERDDMSEQMKQFYDKIDSRLSNLSKTRENLASYIVSFVINGTSTDSQAFLARFERDFPHSPRLKGLRYNGWANQKIQLGAALPPVPLLTQDSTQTTLSALSAGASSTLVLLWNTWEDSCQIALKSVAKLAIKYPKSSVCFKTICVRNRFDSWQEVLKQQWPNAPKASHFYADYPEAPVLEGIFEKKRPLLLLFNDKGQFVERLSPFDVNGIEKWLKK
ncbi:MAG: hypothetical protein EAZ32_03055 [Cytophagia bacterium]|nr:MAG: hypothetical protein EAZ46_02135 [Runella sp.]TAG22434.1 MAG: hypothetical protein EAZ38_05870 [Cytophagales bacterium]TAG41464.1 MAG: hypothetical protein EAZ32_03055 [Cytophagia bacterium]TAG54359.1 MAG: hypothetical protein EAZ29_04660 [Runella slithyformis]TAG71084.1 MAG: hypothetical protein EAZ26_05485 [Runella slithyformis]